MAASYWLQGNRTKAFEAMEKVLKEKPHPFDFYHLAYFHHVNGDQDKALANFKKAHELNPDILKVRETFLKRPPASSPTRKFYQDQFKTAKIYIETGKTPKAIAHESRAPTLEITSVTLEPDPVPVNQAFDFHVKFKADIPGSKSKKIATAFYFKIIQNNKTLFTSKSYPIKVNNGKINTRTQHMNPVPAKGVYTIKVFIKYKKLLAEKNITLTIK
jgi:tetratricopeptide (TPR) repeat protein